MIVGIGTDIIEIARIESACKRPSFIQRVFSEHEIEYYNLKNYAIETLASAFSAKEAASKALGTGFSGFSMHNIEVIRDKFGKPSLAFNGGARERFLSIGGGTAYLSLSHCRGYAVAFVVIESN
ncbi:MAG: holo-ACP synthase [Clostridia bacterium]